VSHFAKIESNIVTQVIVAEQDFINTQEGTWVQTSYNTRGGVHYQPNSNTPSEDQSKALRKNYAGIGYTYDSTKDAFIPPKPFESFTLNETTCLWEAPVSYPTDGEAYVWNEDTQSWDAHPDY
tara:strand:+ start:36 stop:404 length:369 start_codon:yes stop_codon:yes gene_type:complete